MRNRVGCLVALALCGGTVCGIAVHEAAAQIRGADMPAASPPVTPASVESSSAASADGFDTVVKPVIKQSCSVCHNATALTAGLDLSRFLKESGPEALKERAVWEKVAGKLRAGAMPPPGMPRPPAEQLAAIPQWIDRQYAAQDANVKPDPGSVTVRRLNRGEYTNTVRDLLGVNLDAAAD